MSEPKNILVVDDEFDLLQTICAALDLEGYRPLQASNGNDALRILQSEKPDMVLTDVMMPYVSGYELVDEIRKLPDGKDLPVVIMSAIDPGQHPRGRWDGVMLKPFTLENLLATIEKLTREGR